MSKTARKSVISRALSVARKGFADGGSPKEVLGDEIKSVVPDLAPGVSRVMPDARLLARLYRGEGLPTAASRAGLTPEEYERRQGTLSVPVRPGGDTVEQRIASGVARAPHDLIEASGVGQAARSFHGAYGDPTRENIGRAALDAALSVPGMGVIGRGVDHAAGPVARALARAGELLPETATGKAALGATTVGGATLAGTAAAGPLEDFTAEYLKINPFPKEMSREEFIKARRDAAEAPFLSGRRPDPNEAARVGRIAATKAAKDYENEVASLAARREAWQKDFDKAWQTKQRQEKEMGQRPFHERYPDYSAYALPVALAGSAVLPAAGQAMVRGFQTSPVRNAARALDNAVDRANLSRAGAYTGVGTGEAALDNATVLKALQAYEDAVKPTAATFGSKAAGVAGDIAATGTGAALPSLSVQLPYLVDYSQPEGSRARTEAAKQFTPGKLFERMLGPGAAGIGVAGLSRTFGNQASKLAINPGPTKDNLYRAQALKEQTDPSALGATVRRGLEQDDLTREFLRGVAPPPDAPQSGLLRRLFGTRQAEGAAAPTPTALPERAPPPLLGSDVRDPAIDRALDVATKPPALTSAESSKASLPPPAATSSNPSTSKSPSGLPEWAGEPPAGLRLQRGYLWDKNLQQPRHKDGSFGAMPKYSKPKTTAKTPDEPLTPDTIPNKSPKSYEELFDPTDRTKAGLKQGGFVKSAVDMARRYAGGGGVNASDVVPEQGFGDNGRDVDRNVMAEKMVQQMRDNGIVGNGIGNAIAALGGGLNSFSGGGGQAIFPELAYRMEANYPTASKVGRYGVPAAAGMISLPIGVAMGAKAAIDDPDVRRGANDALRWLEKRWSGDAPAARADGGAVDSHVHSGPIVGHDGGRADTKPITVPAGAYIIPADVVSAFGGAGGNTLAGMKALEQAFGHSDPARATGGAVPIKISDGEFVVAPDQVQRVGGGNIDVGHRKLDNFVKRIRAEHIKTLSSLPGPAQS